MHEDFMELLTRIKPEEGILRLYKRLLVDEASKELGRLNTKIRNLRDQLSSVDKARVSTLRKFTEETISIDEKNELIDDYDKQKLEISSQLNELEARQTHTRSRY